MHESLLYVSSSLLAYPGTCEIEAIVSISKSRNASLDVTGCLTFTGLRFAQYLEARPGTLDMLMESICRDKRHMDVVVVQRRPISSKTFKRWTLAYAGASTYVANYVEKLLLPPSNRLDLTRVDQFVSLARTFVSTTNEE